jgi:tRNA (guanine-N7-)-methyltransferase
LISVVESNTELAFNSAADRLELPKIFGHTAPLQVDLGCGDGSFLFELAQTLPEKNFLGVERLAHRVAKATRKAGRVGNMRVLRSETLYAVEYLIPPESVEMFHLLFPDPWPKRRHHRRRIVSNDFLAAIARALQPGGILRIATDELGYFSSIERAVAAFGGFAPVEIDRDFPKSTFEKRFSVKGTAIHRLSLRKISPVA